MSPGYALQLFSDKCSGPEHYKPKTEFKISTYSELACVLAAYLNPSEQIQKRPGFDVKKTFLAVIYVCNKLECLSL
jgi:hypothetical protein